MFDDLWKSTGRLRAILKRTRRQRDEERLFCSQPFTRFEILGGGERGEVVPCCQSWITKTFGNMSDKPVAEVWNSADAQRVRASILDGSFRYCRSDVCPYLQETYGPVQRVDEVTDPQMREVIDKRMTELPFGPTDIICCFDQSCNLSCPSCRQRIIMETASSEAILDIQARLENEALGDARLLHITGSGDPFGSPFFRRWLQTMKRESMPNMVRIHLHTNAQLWTRRIWESIPADIRALVRSTTISIDAATAETYAMNRRGGTFATLLERLAFVSDLRRNGPLEGLDIHMTVQANNFREMPAFVELGRRFGCDQVSFHQLLDWGSFSPEEFESRAIQRPSHPEHQELLAVLANPIFADPMVQLSNLTELRRDALAADNRVAAAG